MAIPGCNSCHLVAQKGNYYEKNMFDCGVGIGYSWFGCGSWCVGICLQRQWQYERKIYG